MIKKELDSKDLRIIELENLLNEADALITDLVILQELPDSWKYKLRLRIREATLGCKYHG